MKVAVLGAGVAGSVTALALTREGHDVVVLDRCSAPPDAGADEVFDSWTAEGIAQHRQPHNFLGLGRAVLRDRLPDVYADLLAAGAVEIDQSTFLGEAPREPDDADLATLACRRPVFDAVLRRHLRQVQQTEVTNLRVEDGRVTGAGSVEADLVVDAGGRGSLVPRWLADAGLSQPEPQQSDCGLLYYSRHYRARDGIPPFASLLGGPRGDLGYLAYAVFLGDNDTFCLCVMTPPWDKPFRELRRTDAFERVALLLPGVASWIDGADPITDVLPMGHLHNVLRAPIEVPGVISLGDARCHTNPTFAYGASLSIAHGVLLSDLTSKTEDLDELTHLFNAEIEADLQARYDAVSAEDRDRALLWRGEQVDSMPIHLRSVVYRVAPQDPALLRAVARRVNALDPVDLLPSDAALLARAQELYDVMTLPALPPRSELIDALVG